MAIRQLHISRLSTACLSPLFHLSYGVRVVALFRECADRLIHDRAAYLQSADAQRRFGCLGFTTAAVALLHAFITGFGFFMIVDKSSTRCLAAFFPASDASLDRSRSYMDSY